MFQHFVAFIFLFFPFVFIHVISRYFLRGSLSHLMFFFVPGPFSLFFFVMDTHGVEV